MLKAFNLRTLGNLRRKFSTTKAITYKVCVAGAAGGVGQTLATLLKVNSLVTAISLYDVEKTKGIAVDLSHIDTFCEVEAYHGKEEMRKAFNCADILLVCAGKTRKPGMSRDDLFKVNAETVAEIAAVAGAVCPKGLIAIVTNPINSNVPLAAEVLKKVKAYDKRRLFGVTAMDFMRTRAFAADILQKDAHTIKVDVIGGHSPDTTLPVLSRCHPKLNLEDDNVRKLPDRVKNAGDEVVKAKEDKGAATLSMAHALNQFTTSLMKGLKNNGAATECTFVESKLTEAPFFASAVELGKNGVHRILPLPPLDAYEKHQLECLLPILIKDIQQGIDFGKNYNIKKEEEAC